MEFVIQIIAGIVGGNLGGLLAKARNLGPLLNTILGALGGLGGGQLLGGPLAELLGNNANLGNAASGGLAGLILPLIGAFLKKK